jgi:hypothetical protein
MADDRKYRQRGYQDADRPQDRPRGPRGPQGPPRERPEGPRGRGLGAPTETVFRCNACGAKQELSGELAAEALCACGAALHSCSNCTHFDTSARWECRQAAAIPARVAKKSAGNTCAAFAPKATQEFGKERRDPSDPRAAFDALFKF